METLDLKSAKIMTDIPLLIVEALSDIADPLTQKMLYVLYNMSQQFLTFYNKHLYPLYINAIFTVMKSKMDWIEFQCAVNSLIVLAK